MLQRLHQTAFGTAATQVDGSQSHETSGVTTEEKSDGSDHDDTEIDDDDIDPFTGQMNDNTPKQQMTQQLSQSQQQQKSSSLSPMTPASGLNGNSSKQLDPNTAPFSFTPIDQNQNNNINSINDFKFDVPSEGSVRKLLQYGDGTPLKNIDINNNNNNKSNNNLNIKNDNFDTNQLLEIPAMDRITEQLRLTTHRKFKF